ncbi:MAG: diacylglycerol kinase family protein [Bacteroidales bacterium]|jgi:YegS/Rv2252/BmrU family lipid kinase|nr:diacylglycerol kinase family protein [Bacteroidales bacterium]
MERIIFFLKPGAGEGIFENPEETIRKKSKQHNYQFTIFNIPEEADRAKIDDAIDKFRPTIAVAGGGDGTVNLVAGIIAGKDIRLGIIPLGSSNGLAYQLSIPDSPGEALDLIARGDSRKIDTLVINDKHMCLHMCDLGMNARVIKRRQDENMGGFLGYVKQYFKELGYKHKFSFDADAGERHITGKAVMVVLANSSYYGTGARITPEGQPDDGRFEIVIVKAYTLRFFLDMLITIFYKNYRNKTTRYILKASKAVITTNKPQEMQIDGEPMGMKDRIEAEIRPASINIICNKKQQV